MPIILTLINVKLLLRIVGCNLPHNRSASINATKASWVRNRLLCYFCVWPSECNYYNGVRSWEVKIRIHCLKLHMTAWIRNHGWNQKSRTKSEIRGLKSEINTHAEISYAPEPSVGPLVLYSAAITMGMASSFKAEVLGSGKLSFFLSRETASYTLFFFLK